MKNLSDIVNVSISIAEPLVDSTSFDNMLIVGPEPQSWENLTDEEREKKETVFLCSSVTEVSDEGALEADTKEIDCDPIGIAGRVAFSQDPKPTKVYFAVNKRHKATINDCNVIVVNTAEDLPEALRSSDLTIDKTPWVIGSCKFNVEADVMNRTTNVALSKGTGELGDDDTVSINVDGVQYTCIPVGDDYKGNYSLRVEDKVYSSASKENLENFTNCSVSFEIDEDGKIITNSYVRKYEFKCEDIEDTLERALLTNGWYVVCPAYTDKNILERIGSWVDSQNKLCIFPVVELPEDDENPICDKSMRCAGIWAKETIDQKLENVPVDNLYIHVAWAAKCLNYIAGSETWALKTLVGIQPASLNSTQMRKLEDLNLNYYTTCAGRDITYNGKVTYGEWIDVIRFRDWQQNDMQKGIYSLLLKNSKIPFTDSGIALVKSEMIASLKRGQKNGGIAETEFNDDGDEIPGFIVTVPRAANITDSQKKSRILNDCKFTARIAGAIHAVDIRGTLAYSL